LGAPLLRRLLAHPLTAGLPLDDPATTQRRKQIIHSKPFLKAIYEEWYSLLAAELPPGEGAVLELGSGAGFCERYIPELITSEVAFYPSVRVVADAHQLPFRDGSLRAIVFTDVMHHMPDVRRFFAGAMKCLRTGGKILMIEPWLSPWSRFVFQRFHNEPFRPEAEDWSFPSSGPLSGANGAIPWIVFVRDRQIFETEFPNLVVERIQPMMPFRYLVSGGVSMRSLMPGFIFSSWRYLEGMLEPRMSSLAMFAFVSVRKR
jgi:SAM-dependent methyltransferase